MGSAAMRTNFRIGVPLIDRGFFGEKNDGSVNIARKIFRSPTLFFFGPRCEFVFVPHIEVFQTQSVSISVYLTAKKKDRRRLKLFLSHLKYNFLKYAMTSIISFLDVFTTKIAIFLRNYAIYAYL